MLTKKNILLLLSFAISCNGFFWQSNQTPQQQQAVQQPNDYYKQVPLSYFRTYTYQPLTYPPAPYTPVQSYPVTSTRLYPNSMPVNNWQRQSQLLQNGIQQPQQLMQIQPMQQQQQQQQPQQIPQQQPPPQPSQQSQPEFTIPQQQMPQQSQQLKPSPSAPPMYGGQSADSYNYQYLPTVTPMNVQHVQFVPCMCPVTVTVSSSSSELLSADKRADELVTSESNESITLLSAEDKTNNLNNL